jgi:hypothetical protein
VKTKYNAGMTMAVAEVEPLPDDLLAPLSRILTPSGWQSVEGHPSLFLRSNTALMSALRCTFTSRSVTVASVSMMFEEDRPLQLSVQPRDLGTFAAVCEVLNRHAGRLDRLDYLDCVTDLLRHVGEVRLECETTGLVPTVARVAGGAVQFEPAPPPEWPPPERQRSELNQRRGAGDASLLPWERAQHKQFPRLLAKDRRRSLSARLAYYEAQKLLRPDEAFVRTIDGGRHAVWLPADDSKGAFAYSIGLGYLHDLPEILLISPLPAMSGATSRALALTVNAIATAMIDGLSLRPGDRYAAVAGIVARTVHKECTLDHAALAQSCFVLPSARIEERTLGGGAWFYANFMDTASFPVLACLLQPPRVPDGYGLPPPPPPAKAKPAPEPVRARPAAAAVKRLRAAAPKPKPKPKRRTAKQPSKGLASRKAVKKSRKARPGRK